MAELEQLAILGQIALAMLLGSVIGYDREVHDKPAGLRTVGIISRRLPHSPHKQKKEDHKEFP